MMPPCYINIHLYVYPSSVGGGPIIQVRSGAHVRMPSNVPGNTSTFENARAHHILYENSDLVLHPSSALQPRTHSTLIRRGSVL